MKNFALRYPFLFALLVSLAAIFSQVWAYYWLSGLPLGAQVILGRATACLIAVFLLTSLGWWREAGFVRITSWRILLPYLPLILVVLLAMFLGVGLSGIRARDPGLILLGTASFLMGGFIEESLFRGIVLRLFLPRGLMKAALLSALVFSLVHLANMLLGQSLGATALQLVRAFLLGFAFVAPLAVTRNIWPLVFLHFLINYSSFLSSGNLTLISTEDPQIGQVVAEVVVFGLLSVWGFWLLRRAEQAANRLPSSAATVA